MSRARCTITILFSTFFLFLFCYLPWGKRKTQKITPPGCFFFLFCQKKTNFSHFRVYSIYKFVSIPAHFASCKKRHYIGGKKKFACIPCISRLHILTVNTNYINKYKSENKNSWKCSRWHRNFRNAGEILA